MIRLSHNGFVAALAAGIALVSTGALAQAVRTEPGFHAPYKDKPVVPDPNAIDGAPPPALPGTLNPYGAAAKTQMDLPPTDALFDGINRGDIATVRDAVSRGADLYAHNMLGLSPIDLSIDLSRNDITFLLLSLGAADPAPAPGAAKKPAAKTATTAKAPAKPAAAPQPLSPAAAKLAANTGGKAGLTPLGSNPGTPDPQAGFLGFGSTVQ